MTSFAELPDKSLIAAVRTLAGNERQAMARLVASLGEFDSRRLYLGEGCSSLFTYCTQVLRLSEHAAYGRIEARASRATVPSDPGSPRGGRDQSDDSGPSCSAPDAGEPQGSSRLGDAQGQGGGRAPGRRAEPPTRRGVHGPKTAGGGPAEDFPAPCGGTCTCPRRRVGSRFAVEGSGLRAAASETPWWRRSHPRDTKCNSRSRARPTTSSDACRI